MQVITGKTTPLNDVAKSSVVLDRVTPGDVPFGDVVGTWRGNNLVGVVRIATEEGVRVLRGMRVPPEFHGKESERKYSGKLVAVGRHRVLRDSVCVPKGYLRHAMLAWLTALNEVERTLAKNNGLGNLVRCSWTAHQRLRGQLLNTLPDGIGAFRARRSGLCWINAGGIFSRPRFGSTIFVLMDLTALLMRCFREISRELESTC
jgi:hypothetical protein